MSELMSVPSTYTSGFQVSKPSVTKGDIVRLCDELKTKFGPHYTFVPEKICEGGIRMTTWTDMKVGVGYKTMRFGVTGRRTNGKWPWINEEDALAAWRDEKQAGDVIFEPCDKNLFYKAFDGAPVWTADEEKRLAEAFTQIGFACRKVSKAKTRDKQLQTN